MRADLDLAGLVGPQSSLLAHVAVDWTPEWSRVGHVPVTVRLHPLIHSSRQGKLGGFHEDQFTSPDDVHRRGPHAVTFTPGIRGG